MGKQIDRYQEQELVIKLGKLYANQDSAAPREDIDEQVEALEKQFDVIFGKDAGKWKNKAFNVSLGWDIETSMRGKLRVEG